MATEVLIDLKVDTGSSAKNLLNIQKQLKELTALGKEQVQLEKDQQKLQKLGADLDAQGLKRLAELKRSEADRLAQGIDLKQQRTDANRQVSNEIKFNKSLEGSNEQLRATLSLLTKQYNGLSENQRENTKEGKKLGENIDKITSKLKENESAVGDNRRNVGNYKESIVEAFQELEKSNKEIAQNIIALEEQRKEVAKGSDEFEFYGTELAKLENDLEANNKALGKSSTEVAGFGSALEGTKFGGFIAGIKATGAAFLANPIGIFVAALAALGAAFSKSEKAQRLLSKGTAVIGALFGELVEFSVVIADGIQSAFEDPIGAIKNLGQLLIDNIINRFKAIAIFGEGIGKLLEGKFTEGFKTLTDATVQLSTGVTNVTDRVSELAEEVGKAVDAGLKIEEAEFALKQYSRTLKVAIKDLQAQEELQRSIADDATKSFKEREEAAELARVASEARAAKEIELAESELNLANQRVNLAQEQGLAEQELLDQRLAAIEAVKDAELGLTTAIRENEKQRAELKQDRLEKDLDILIDGFDNQKTINDKIIDDDKRPLEERIAKLNETVALGEASFNKQVETIQQFTDFQVNANDLLNESDAVRLNEKIRALELSEIIEGRLLEVIRDRRTAEDEFRIQDEELGIVREEKAEKDVEKEIERQTRILDASRNIEDSKVGVAKDSAKLFKTITKGNAEAQKAALVAEKGLAIADIVINTQREISGIALANTALGPVAGPIATASQTLLAKIRAGISIASIAATSFQEGGLLNGASHDNGGIPFTVQGKGGFEAEGGEAIINKKSTKLFAPLLSQINSFKGFGKKFADGGVISPAISAPIAPGVSNITNIFNTDELASQIGSAVSQNTNVVLPVESLNETQNNINTIENSVTF